MSQGKADSSASSPQSLNIPFCSAVFQHRLTQPSQDELKAELFPFSGGSLHLLGVVVHAQQHKLQAGAALPPASHITLPVPHQPHSLLCPGTGTLRMCQPCLGDCNTAEESSCKGPVWLHPNQSSPLFPASDQELLPELGVLGPQSDPQTGLHVEALTRAVFSWQVP